MTTPILAITFETVAFTPILISGNSDEKGKWTKALTTAEKQYEGKHYLICKVDLRTENLVAKRFKKNLLVF